jgi:thiamine pyrophosphate-dependent acetolactate synthase large subunit-like protein
MLATEMLPEFEAKAKERMSLGGKTKKGVAIDTPLKTRKKAQRATEEAGKQFGISGSIVHRANRIKKAADEGEIEKETIADIIKGKKTVNAVDKELHDKRYVKKAKEDEKKENKKLPNQHPKAVKDYIDFLHEAKNKIDLATKLKQEGMFPPESMQFIKRLHSQIIEMFKYMEENNEENDFDKSFPRPREGAIA